MFPLYDENPRATRPYVNYVLIAVNFGVFIWEVIVTGFFTNEEAVVRIFIDYGFVPVKFLESGPLRIEAYSSMLSSIFMHGGIIHLLGNMLFLWVFGDNIEDRFGHGKYLGIYLFWGFFASMVHLVWAMSVGGNQLLIPAVGASGAISGVLGAYLLMFPRAKVITLLFFFFITTTRIPAFAYLIIWFVFQLFSASFGAGSDVAYLAHIGGFAIGAVFGALYRSLIKVRLKLASMPTKRSEQKTLEPRRMEQVVRPLRMEGITTDEYVEILVEMPGVSERSIVINVSDNIVFIDAVTEDGYKKYGGKAILRVKVKKEPEFTHYLNGVLRIRLSRV
ncbi:MAG: rhomboid family intramembrane serine protease [Thaumarchaeota archaeon]|nr:rhomboid family intramembrane serine protease [Nitrososphaerota archaeon]